MAKKKKNRVTCNVDSSLDSKEISYYNMMLQLFSNVESTFSTHIKSISILLFTYMYFACTKEISAC